MAIEALHHIGLLSFLIVLGGLIYIIKKWGKHHHLSLSNHAALQKPSYRIFAGSLALGGVLFYVFALGWLIPTLQLGWLYGVLLTVAIACELVAAFVPDGKHGKGKIHRLTAWTMAVCMLLLTVSLLFAPVGGVVAKYIVAVLASYMFFEWILFVFVKWSRRFFLIFQSAYVLSFYLAVLVMTYVG